MRLLATAAVAAGMVLGAGVAQADVIFQFVTTSYGSTDPLVNGIPLTATFDLKNTGETGSFNISGIGGVYPVSYVVSDNIRSAAIQGADLLQTTQLLGQVNVSVSFVDGVVTSSSLLFLGVTDDVQVSGTGPTASGYLSSDGSRCGDYRLQRCFVSGYFTQVPEPMTATLFGTAVMGLAFSRRRT